MKIVVDAMGGDNAPEEIVKGALMAAQEFGVKIVLTGDGDTILRVTESMGHRELPEGVEITHAPEVVTMEDDPAMAVRVKPESSMAVGLQLLADGMADAMVSAGNTGALLTGATLIVRRIRGVRRACLAPYFPNGSGGGTLVADCGANVECKPEYLLQFAYMGSYYMESVMGVPDPRIGLLNIGTEETKGTELQKEAYKLLMQAAEKGDLNFIGNVEARDTMTGVCDVLVCDGYSGNILLKAVEGTGRYLLNSLKGILTKNLKTKLAAALVKNDIKEMKKLIDPSEVGGTALLGIASPVIKAHGSSNAYAIRSAIKQAITTVNAGVCADIQDNVKRMKLKTQEA